MKSKLVKDIMLPLTEYAVVSEDATLLEALKALDKAQDRLPPGKQPHRAVLVVDRKNQIIGKLGHHGFLQALEPKYGLLGDMDRLSRAGLQVEFINSMMENYRFWQDDLTDICRRAQTIKVKDVMKPVDVSIDENSNLAEALHRFILENTLSILVSRGREIVGILRMSDLFTEISNYVKNTAF
ncbi:MAG: CBS domain-containing protein [Calditrichota bacterium]